MIALTCQLKGRSPGRPVDEDKTDAIVSAARSAFFDLGFVGTTIEEVARRAGVSKVTVYSRFGDKQALFVAAIEAECRTMNSQLRFDITGSEALRTNLIAFGTAMLRFLNRPELVRFENMLGGEMERHPELGELFLNAGPRPMIAVLASMIGEAAHRGEIAVADPRSAAELLGSMFKGFADLERRFAPHAPSRFCDAERIAYAVDVFLKAHRPG